ncbi:unnamed protein product [Eretmochelys imbricata]
MIVKQASDLWADHLTATDAFVKIFFESKEIWTGTIWNNNNPIWNVHLDFGTVCITSASKIRVQVWDEDNNWDDDLLGSCNIPLVAGGPQADPLYVTDFSRRGRAALPSGHPPMPWALHRNRARLSRPG